MKYEQFKSAMDSKFQTLKNGKTSLNVEYLIDSVELVMKNTRVFSEQIYNKRVKPHTPVFSALMSECSSLIQYEHGWNPTEPSTKQLEKYFSEYGYDYKILFEPLVNYVKEKREGK